MTGKGWAWVPRAGGLKRELRGVRLALVCPVWRALLLGGGFVCCRCVVLGCLAVFSCRGCLVPELGVVLLVWCLVWEVRLLRERIH